MNMIYKISTLLLIAAATFLLSFYGENQYNIMASATVSVVSLIVASAFLFLDRIFKNLTGDALLYILTGVLLGSVFGYFLGELLQKSGLDLTGFRTPIYLLPTVLFGYTGYLFAGSPGFRISGGAGLPFGADKDIEGVREKILDTSVIIDGRILDIAETHFIDGPFIIPNFVLREIQLISDSPDPVKRNRGRRGLDMLNKLQQQGSVKVKISYVDYSDMREVDAKLVKLARETGGKLVTNDFNLNKVAELQGVEVLNLNNLTNALKPVVLPGEDILIDVIKEGKDENQGIGYLEDGTMVVVENGRSLLGKAVRVNVTSIIQTAAGKMIFTRATGSAEESEDDRRGKQQHDRGRRGMGGGRKDEEFREVSGGGRRRR
jgi:uncharacterized protein YacL